MIKLIKIEDKDYKNKMFKKKLNSNQISLPRQQIKEQSKQEKFDYLYLIMEFIYFI